jgi:ABC-type branched-subunit amino acid transport system substrate-binding protein
MVCQAKLWREFEVNLKFIIILDDNVLNITFIGGKKKGACYEEKLLPTAIICVFPRGLVFFACSPKDSETIKIGINAPLTGDIPKVGEGTKFAAQMWLEDVNAAGGIDIGGKK